MIASEGGFSGTGTYTIDSSKVIVVYVASNSSGGGGYTMTSGTITITNFPPSTGGYLTGTFSGKGMSVTSSGEVTAPCTDGKFSIYR
jgi:hypothetical protein